jgi:hypothetical protein
MDMKNIVYMLAAALFILTTAGIGSDSGAVDYMWNIRASSWEGISFKVLPSWHFIKGIDTLIITNSQKDFYALIMLRYDQTMTKEKLLETINQYKIDYIYKTTTIKGITPLKKGGSTVGQYFVSKYNEGEMIDPGNKDSYAFVCRALRQFNNLYLDLILIGNDSESADFKQIISMLETCVPHFGA